MRLRFGRAGATLASLLAAAACASRTGSASQGPVIVREPEDPLLAELRGRPGSAGERPVRDSIAAPPQQVHRALVAAFRQLGIPVQIADAATGQVANPQFQVRRELGGTRLSRFLECGETLTGPRADNDRVAMSVVSDVRPAGGGTSRVETRVVGVATDTGGTGRRSPCSSTGELELRLHQAARAALGS